MWLRTKEKNEKWMHKEERGGGRVDLLYRQETF